MKITKPSIKNFVNWYITKYRPNEFLKKEDWYSTLVKEKNIAKENEAKRVNDFRDQKEREALERQQREYELVLAEQEATISQLQTRLEHLEKYKKEVDDMRFEAIKWSKENMRVTADWTYTVQRLLKEVANITGRFEGLEEESRLHYDKINGNIKKDQKKLI